MREFKILGGVTLKAKFAFANILMDFFFFLYRGYIPCRLLHFPVTCTNQSSHEKSQLKPYRWECFNFTHERMTFLHKPEHLHPINGQTRIPMRSCPQMLQHSLYDVLPYHTNTSTQDPAVSPQGLLSLMECSLLTQQHTHRAITPTDSFKAGRKLWQWT